MKEKALDRLSFEGYNKKARLLGCMVLHAFFKSCGNKNKTGGEKNANI